jgi:hypothetical protein
VPPALGAGSGQDKDGSGHGNYDEVVQFGSGRSSGGRWLPGIVLACLVLAAIVAIAVRATPQHARHAAKTPPPVQVIGAGVLPGVTGGCELFTRGPDDVPRSDLAQGKIPVAYMPPPQSASPNVALVTGPHEAVIRSTGLCPGTSCPAAAKRRC